MFHKSLDFYAIICYYAFIMNRYLSDRIYADLKKKMVFITGPRQVGKTFLAKEISSKFSNPVYLNYDNQTDASIIRKASWPRNAGIVALDEVHKMKNWKQHLKGIYDTKYGNQAILVTGSARLETFRRSGESLAGRYFHLRLNPLSVKELSSLMQPYDAVSSLNRLGGFPEPFLSASEEEAARWRKQYYTDIIHEDVLDFGRLHEIRAMRVLLEMLRMRVGSPISYTALAEDLQISPNTVRRYVEILEALYVIFAVRPFHKNIARSLLKEPKLYFFDSGFVQGDEGARYENTVAVSLLKHANYLEDTMGKEVFLHYLRTRDGREVDFAVSQSGELETILEVKTSDTEPSRALRFFKAACPGASAVQLVHNTRNAEEIDGINIVNDNWLSELSA